MTIDYEKLSYKLVDKYMHGSCMLLAAALHYRFSLPINVLVIHHACGPKHFLPRCVHAWIEIGKEQHVDIQGVQTIQQIVGNYYYPQDDLPRLLELRQNIAIEELEELCDRQLLSHQDDVLQAYEDFKLVFNGQIFLVDDLIKSLL